MVKVEVTSQATMSSSASARTTEGLKRRKRRVYNKSDKLVAAMLTAGLEYLITSGFYMEDEYAGPCHFMPAVKRNQHGIIYRGVPSKNPPEDSRALAEIMEELYQLEKEYKRKL